MEGPGAPGPGAWAAGLPAGLPAPPPGWGGWEPRALAAAALATAVRLGMGGSTRAVEKRASPLLQFVPFPRPGERRDDGKQPRWGPD